MAGWWLFSIVCFLHIQVVGNKHNTLIFDIKHPKTSKLQAQQSSSKTINKIDSNHQQQQQQQHQEQQTALFVCIAGDNAMRSRYEFHVNETFRYVSFLIETDYRVIWFDWFYVFNFYFIIHCVLSNLVSSIHFFSLNDNVLNICVVVLFGARYVTGHLLMAFELFEEKRVRGQCQNLLKVARRLLVKIGKWSAILNHGKKDFQYTKAGGCFWKKVNFLESLVMEKVLTANTWWVQEQRWIMCKINSNKELNHKYKFPYTKKPYLQAEIFPILWRNIYHWTYVNIL